MRDMVVADDALGIHCSLTRSFPVVPIRRFRQYLHFFHLRYSYPYLLVIFLYTYILYSYNGFCSYWPVISFPPLHSSLQMQQTVELQIRPSNCSPSPWNEQHKSTHPLVDRTHTILCQGRRRGTDVFTRALMGRIVGSSANLRCFEGLRDVIRPVQKR